jgi:hypothetical protein
MGADIIEGSIKTNNGRVRNRFKLEIVNRNQLRLILGKLQRIKGVEKAVRIRSDDQVEEK